MRSALKLLPFALVLAGCAPQPQQIGGIPRSGRVPSVVSLSPSAAEIIATSMDMRLLVGRTAADDYPTSLAPVPVVAETKPDFEKIQKIKPTLLVYDADLYSEADVKKIEAMGIETFVFKDHTVEGFEKEVYELSGKLGSETNVNDYITRIERARNEAVAEVMSGRPNPKPKVAIVLGGNYVAGTESFAADVIKIGGGIPVGPAADKFAAMSPEALVAAAPDIIVLPTTKDNAAKDLAALRALPGVAATPAAKNNRIVALTQDIVLRRGGRVDAFIRDLHRALLQKTSN